jgi:hypothetical protein
LNPWKMAFCIVTFHGIFQNHTYHVNWNVPYTASGTVLSVCVTCDWSLTGFMLDGSLQERSHESGEVDGESRHTVSKWSGNDSIHFNYQWQGMITMVMMLVMVNIWILYLASQYSECIILVFSTLSHVFIMLFLSNLGKQQSVLYWGFSVL